MRKWSNGGRLMQRISTIFCTLFLFTVTSPLIKADGWSLTGKNGEQFGESRQHKRNCQGTGCGAATGHDCGPLDVEISSNPAVGKVGEPLTLKYDGTPICNGQSVQELITEVKWDAGGPMRLDDAYGFATKTYQTAGGYEVSFEVRCRCFDPKGSSYCVAKGSVHVSIKP
jgi:hypothetical protein